MFIFNLKKTRTWNTVHSSLNILINTNTGNIIENLIDFGYHSALQFDYNQNEGLTVRYSKSGDFINDPTNNEINIPDEKT